MATRHYKGFRLIGDRQGDGSRIYNWATVFDGKVWTSFRDSKRNIDNHIQMEEFRKQREQERKGQGRRIVLE